ncbi:hypothetical protein BDZ94DRAFT_692198 [Collybia nuda]|uniref:Tetraspanin Tsp2 n=1 Tax=Collybia nuda TaxID=64659 RepID=A0A9P5YHG4_9AGAR|nr:hypothetical protein BDZ94DRAFT_692198 [Collybia nuda]
MERRIPSLSVVGHTFNNLRRRSGNHSSRENSLSPRNEQEVNPTQHTVLLVEHSLPSQPSYILPFAAVAEEHLIHRNRLEEEQESLLGQVLLTPRPDPPFRVESDGSVQTAETHISQISRLPTPDFGSALNSPIEIQVKSRFGPAASPVLFSSTPAPSRPQSVRTESKDSDGSAWSTGADDSDTVTTDSGHNAIIPAIGTTTKFTHKWPRPQSLRYPKSGNDSKSMASHQSESVAIILEDGQGPGTVTVYKWNLFKWSLFFSVLTVFSYGAAGLACAIMTWFRTWEHADVFYVADNDILILITLAASILVFTALVGISGVFLNSRPILATYAILLWPALVSLLAVGYISYKRTAFSLDHKLNLSWSQYYTSVGRLLIQNALQCCGYYNTLHDATPSKQCYSRSPLPGCKSKLYHFENENLNIIWSATFALVPLHLLNITIALLCSNHLTKTFGTGMTPKQYRLSSSDVKADADKILRGMRQAFRWGVQGKSRRPIISVEISLIFDKRDTEEYTKCYSISLVFHKRTKSHLQEAGRVPLNTGFG